MNFINQVNLTVFLSEFILGVNEDQTALRSDLCSTLEDSTSVLFQFQVIFFRNDSLCKNLFARNIFVVTNICLSCWRKKRLWETISLAP